MTLNELIEQTKYFTSLQDFKLKENLNESYREFKVWDNETHKVYGTYDSVNKVYTIDFTMYNA